jgi:hypothetical protein
MQSNAKPKYFKLGYLDLVSTKLGMKQDVEMITIHMEKKGTKSIVSPKLVLEVVSTLNFDFTLPFPLFLLIFYNGSTLVIIKFCKSCKLISDFMKWHLILFALIASIN